MQNLKFAVSLTILISIVPGEKILQAQVATVSNPPTPRQAGIGFAAAALEGGATSAWFNPAGLAAADEFDAFISYQRPFNLPFFRDFAAAVAYPISNYGTFSLSARSFSVTYQDVDLSAERTVSLSHGFYLQKDIHSSLAVGYTLRLMYWSLGESVNGLNLGSAFSGGVDLGVMGTLWGRTRVGGMIRNLNAPTIGKVQKHQLPRMVLLGLAYEPYRGVLTTLGAEKVLGAELRMQGGIELEVFGPLWLRAGAFSQPNSFTLGFGLNHESLGFDYAYVSHPTLEGSHLVGLHFSP